MEDKIAPAEHVCILDALQGGDRAVARGFVVIEEFEIVQGERVTVRKSTHNTITTQGLQGVADNLLDAPTLGKPTHMAVGTGAPPGGNALANELDRVALSSKTRNDAVVTMVAAWNAGDATGTVTELGVFDDPVAGNMWFSANITSQPIYLSATRGATITWTLTVSGS